VRPLEHAYNTLLTLGAVGTVPLWGALLIGRKRHRAGLLQKITGNVSIRHPSSGRAVWYHAVSLGEVMASLPLMKGLMDALPHRPLWISTATATGQSMARSRVPRAAGTFYFPLDHPCVVDRVIRRLRPGIFIAMETEIWPNTVWRLRHRGVPVVLVNGRISDGSFAWYRRFRFFFRDVLECFDLLCMQSEVAAERIRAIGAPPQRVVVTGNMKFDQELPQAVDRSSWLKELGLGTEGSVLVAGSTHRGEEEIILRVFKRLRPSFPGLRLVLAPRAPERFDEVEALARGMGLRFKRRSGAGTSGTGSAPEVLLLDTIGELARVYGVAEVGFVGGSVVPRGGHNPLEVAAHGCPVIFGPHMENFPEIAAVLMQAGGAREVSNEEELFEALEELLSHRERASQMGAAAYRALLSHRGAVKRTMEALGPLLERAHWA
jgi:3-deoxy-D-manno-octulosonic-acid transferase